MSAKLPTVVFMKGVTDYGKLTRFHELVEAVRSGSKVELFGRGHREGCVSNFFEPAHLGWREFEPPADERPLAEVA